VQFAERVFGIKKEAGMTDEAVGKLGIDALKAKFKSWGMPLTLAELGVKREDIPKLALDMTQNPEGVLLKQETLIEVLESCYE
jgi:alcohol dehydrogenase YqhD (iron-dependent ADH family)